MRELRSSINPKPAGFRICKIKSKNMEPLLLTGSTIVSDPNLLLKHRELPICEGATLRLTSGFASGGVVLSEAIGFTEHQAAFNFCLSGRQTFSLTGNYLPTLSDNRKINALLLPDEQFTIQTHGQGEFSTVFLQIALPKYLSLLGSAVEMLPKNFQIAAEQRNLCYFKNHEWQPRLRAVVTQLAREEFASPLAGRLFLESKMLEIVAIMLDFQHRSTQDMAFLPRRDEEKIRFARLILEQNLSNPPSLAQLARRIESNEFTLKRGFKLLFGMPVFKFLQKMRMEKAAELLRDGQLQVAEVAMAVGYENVSAFTRAFQTEHLILPSDLRKTPFRHI